MIGPVERPVMPQNAAAANAAWAELVPAGYGPHGGGTAGTSPTASLLAGTVTPGQVRRALVKDLPACAVDNVLRAVVLNRAAGGRALRATIQAHEKSGAAGGMGLAQLLMNQVLQAEPARAAGPAVRSLMRAFEDGRLRMDPASANVLMQFFEANGYGPAAAGRLANGVPFNITEADQEAAQLLARAGGAWHPDVAYTKPTAARVRICVIDNGFDVAHPLLATKIVPANNPAPVPGTETPYVHPPESAQRHGTAMVGIATGRTHVAEAVLLQYGSTGGNKIATVIELTRLAAAEAKLVNLSAVFASRNPQQQAASDHYRIKALRAEGDILLVQAAGNRDPFKAASQLEGNLAVSGEPNVLTVGGYDEPDGLDPGYFVYHPTAVHTLAPATALAPNVRATSEMDAIRGSSVSTASTTNLAAIMAAMAPHLAEPRLKALIEGTAVQTPAWQAADPKPSAHGMVDRGRALRLAAVEGLVVSGTTDPVRIRTVAQAAGNQAVGARQKRTGGRMQVAPGMTAGQAADALKLTGATRAQVLADHTRLCVGWAA